MDDSSSYYDFTGRIQALLREIRTTTCILFFRSTIAAGDRIHVVEEGRYSNSGAPLRHANGKVRNTEALIMLHVVLLESAPREKSCQVHNCHKGLHHP